jgi:ribosome biogenesis protein Tsr3
MCCPEGLAARAAKSEKPKKARKKKMRKTNYARSQRQKVNQVLVVLDRQQRSISFGEAGQRVEARTEGR